jgi:hypothetical protein
MVGSIRLPSSAVVAIVEPEIAEPHHRNQTAEQEDAPAEKCGEARVIISSSSSWAASIPSCHAREGRHPVFCALTVRHHDALHAMEYWIIRFRG